MGAQCCIVLAHGRPIVRGHSETHFALQAGQQQHLINITVPLRDYPLGLEPVPAWPAGSLPPESLVG